MVQFLDRTEAGQKLAAKIAKNSLEIENGIILGLPRGGVIVAKEVAEELELPLDIIVTRKIGAPHNPEYAVAAVGSNQIVINPKEEVDSEYLKRKVKEERLEINRRTQKYRGNISLPKFKDKTVILVDDGLATGLTMEAAIQEAKYYKPKKIIIAVPVAPPETINKLKNQVDQIIVLNIEPYFFAVGQFYQSFPEVRDEEVVAIFKQNNYR